MKKVKLKHSENDKQINRVCLEAWIKEGVNEGLAAYRLQTYSDLLVLVLLVYYKILQVRIL